jgi:hypothetical protein
MTRTTIPTKVLRLQPDNNMQITHEHTLPEKVKSPVSLNDILINNSNCDQNTQPFKVDQNITGIELFNSIYNLWIHFFTKAPSFTALKERNNKDFNTFQNKIFDDGFDKIFTALSTDSRSIYYINKEREILIYCSLGKGLVLEDSDSVVEHGYASLNSFSVSICSAINYENIKYVEDFVKFYSTLEGVTKTDDQDSVFYMIAQTMQGLKKIKAECKPKPIKDNRYDLYYGKKFPIEKFRNFMENEENQNLLLLHGDPGTGKSNLIRHLIKMSKRPTIYIPPSMVASIASPNFIEFIMENKGSTLLIEDAEEILSNDRNAATNNLLGLTDGFLKDCINLKIICSFNKDIRNIDAALRRPGRLFFEYKFGKLDEQEVGELVDYLELDILEKDVVPMTLAEIFAFGQELRQDNSLDKPVMGFARLAI